MDGCALVIFATLSTVGCIDAGARSEVPKHFVAEKSSSEPVLSCERKDEMLVMRDGALYCVPRPKIQSKPPVKRKKYEDGGSGHGSAGGSRC